MKRTQLFYLLLFVFGLYQAQERLGITNSNYYSSAAIQLNPSAIVDSRTYMQFHLIGLNVFAKTNFAYLPNFNMRQAFGPLRYEKAGGNTKKYLYLNGSVEGPAFVFSKRTYGLGLFVRARLVVDMRRVSYDLASAVLGGQGIAGQQSRTLLGEDFKNAKLSAMSWVEYGGNFGKMIRRDRDVLVSVGGNLKYITGIQILYANFIEFNSYYNNDFSFGVNNLNAKLVRNQPRWRAGRGFGLDLGITYKKMENYVAKYYAHSKLSNCKYVDYKYKIALSLRDAGYIRFKGQTVHTRVKGSGHFDPQRRDTAFLEAVQSNFQNTTVNEKPILASLPTALTGQLDYNFDNSIYLNFTVVKNLVPNRITGVQSPDLLSVCPRIEFRQFELAVPFALQKFIYPQVGLGLRFRSFVVGTDNILPFIVTRDTYGANIYFSLAISIFRNKACDVKGSSVSDCPSYKKKGKNRPKKRKSFSSRRR